MFLIMKFKGLLGRMTGFNCPIFGVSWTPSTSDRSVATRVISYLEDRRVLYNDYAYEVPQQCVDSVLQIRQYLTDELKTLSPDSELAAPLKSMRAACRKFLDDTQRDLEWQTRRWPIGSDFFISLGELRSSFGLHVAILAVQYGINIEGDLVKILPPEDVDEKTG